MTVFDLIIFFDIIVISVLNHTLIHLFSAFCLPPALAVLFPHHLFHILRRQNLCQGYQHLPCTLIYSATQDLFHIF